MLDGLSGLFIRRAILRRKVDNVYVQKLLQASVALASLGLVTRDEFASPRL